MRGPELLRLKRLLAGHGVALGGPPSGHPPNDGGAPSRSRLSLLAAPFLREGSSPVPARVSLEETTMRLRLVLSLCVVTMAALLPGPRSSASFAASVLTTSATPCCTPQVIEGCARYGAHAVCVNGICECDIV
jgi:hypothetical protein